MNKQLEKIRNEKYRHIRRATALVHDAIVAGEIPSPRGMKCADCGGIATQRLNSAALA